jgi:uncharacterized RDD family membrane protein YckC
MNTTNSVAPALWRRFAAIIYDTLLVAAVSILYGAIMAGIHSLIYGAPAAGERISWGAGQPLIFGGWLICICGFFCYFWHSAGQTLGMKTWRLKILSADGQLPSYSQCILRCLLAPASLALLGAGYWLLYTQADRQTLHDRFSQTRTWLVNKN